MGMGTCGSVQGHVRSTFTERVRVGSVMEGEAGRVEDGEEGRSEDNPGRPSSITSDLAGRCKCLSMGMGMGMGMRHGRRACIRDWVT